MNIVQISENTLIILFEQTISPEVSNQVASYQREFEQNFSEYILDITPSYASITIVFDFRKILGKAFISLLSKSMTSEPITTVIDLDSDDTHSSVSVAQNIVEIPVYYHSDVGFDLISIAAEKKLSTGEVIRIHSEQTYDVYAVGFAPGFAYLGSVDERIAMPRKQTPRKHVPTGSLGIAGQQTAIYPSNSPGGWQIIGRTPLPMVDYAADEPSRVKTGDKVQFIPISKQRYLELGGELEKDLDEALGGEL